MTADRVRTFVEGDEIETVKEKSRMVDPEILFSLISIMNKKDPRDAIKIAKAVRKYIREASEQPGLLEELAQRGCHVEFMIMFQDTKSMELMGLAVDVMFQWAKMTRDVSLWMTKELILPLVIVSTQIPDEKSEIEVHDCDRHVMIQMLHLVYQLNKDVFREFGVSELRMMNRLALVFDWTVDGEIKASIARMITALLNDKKNEFTVENVSVLRFVFQGLPRYVNGGLYDVIEIATRVVVRGDDFARFFIETVDVKQLFGLFRTVMSDLMFHALSALFCALLRTDVSILNVVMNGFNWTWLANLFKDATSYMTEQAAYVIDNVLRCCPEALRIDDASAVVESIVVQFSAGKFREKEILALPLWRIISIASGDLLAYLVDNNIVETLCEFLHTTSDHGNTDLVVRSLHALFNYGEATANGMVMNHLMASDCLSKTSSLMDDEDTCSDSVRLFHTALISRCHK